MLTRDTIVIGGSTGALEALRTIIGGLPRDLAASVFVALHTSPNSPGLLDAILRRAGPLPVQYATDREPIEHGRIYLAPPGRHLLVKRDHVRVTNGPRENRFRPAVDPLFRTAAVAHGPRVIGIVLSGGQDDGAVGLALLKQRGGIAIVQDADDAIAYGMPQAAIRHVAVDHVLLPRQMPDVLAKLVRDRIELPEATMANEDLPPDIAEGGDHMIHHAGDLGPASPFTCPECGGTLWQSVEGEILQFRCHLGHRYSGDSLAGAQSEGLEQALWAALRALEESAELRRRMAHRALDRGLAAIGASYSEDANDSEHRAGLIRRVLLAEKRPEQVPIEQEQEEEVASPRKPRKVAGNS